MTERDDALSRRYRALAHEEPPAALDAAILAKARQGASAPGAGASGAPRGMARWMGPVSIAAVLVLGIGVSMRMQLEEPGVETSHPTYSAEYPMPSAEPVPIETPVPGAPAPVEAPAARTPATAPVPLAKRSEAPPDPARKPEPNPFADAPPAMQQPPVPASPATTLAATAPVPAAPPAPVRAERAVAEEAQRSAPPPAAGAAPQFAPQRAKRQDLAADTAAARESRAIASVADPDPARELERIARLREAGRHGDADRALEELRRRHPDFRIPEAMWERVKPR